MNSDSSRSSVTEWLDGVKDGSDSAAPKIWERYVGQLVREANRRLKNPPHRQADGDDDA
ncbi:MAG: ECF-type sigma factor [Pirellulaceae bacterium]